MPKKIGNDEFCLTCMEWREYDEKGRCKICKHIIYRVKEIEKEGYDKYHSESPTFEIEDETPENGDY